MSEENGKKWYDYLDITNTIKLGGDKLLGTTEEERKRALALQAGEGGRISGGRRPFSHIINEIGSRGVSLAADVVGSEAIGTAVKGVKAAKYGAKGVTPNIAKSSSRLAKINKNIKAAEKAKKQVEKGVKEFASKVDYSKLPKNTGYKELDEISSLIENGDVTEANKKLFKIIDNLDNAKYNIDNPGALYTDREWDPKEFKKAMELSRFIRDTSAYGDEVEKLFSGLTKEGYRKAKEYLDKGYGYEYFRDIFEAEGKTLDRHEFYEKINKDKISSLTNTAFDRISKEAKTPVDVDLNILPETGYIDVIDFAKKEAFKPGFEDKKEMFKLTQSEIDAKYSKAIKEGKTFDEFSKDLADEMHYAIKDAQPAFEEFGNIRNEIARSDIASHAGTQSLFRKGELDDIQESINSLKEQAIAYNNLVTFDNQVKKIGKNEHLDKAFEIERKRLQDALDVSMGKDEKFFKDIDMLNTKLNSLGKEKRKVVLQLMTNMLLDLLVGSLETRAVPTIENALKNGGNDAKNYFKDTVPTISNAYIRPDFDPISSRVHDFVLDLLDVNPSDPADYDMKAIDEMIKILIDKGQIHRDNKYLSDSDKIKLLKKAGKNERARDILRKEYIERHNSLKGKRIYNLKKEK